MNFKNTLAILGFAAVASQAISYSPVDANATDAAKKLYNFLATNYGVKSISGMMTGDLEAGDADGSNVLTLYDVDSLYDVSGYYPVLVGFDFLFATGVKASDTWYQGYTQLTLTYAASLWSQGGIPAFTWHWKDPSDAVDAFYYASEASESYTNYDFTEGFYEGTTTWDESSTVYQQIIGDIDEIAALFLQLQDQDVAAIFRPIHEASGAWFWWGVCEGEEFAALYQLIYDRMVNTDGVHNLVWVWNPEYANDTDWDPGTSYYDVISLDIYSAMDYTTKFTKAWDTLTTNYSSHEKIFAISENGPIPDISTMKDYGSVWSWWMPWYQSWDGAFLDQTVDAVWQANMSDPCVITLDEMPGWDSYTISSESVDACTVGYALGDLDTAREAVEVDLDIDNCNGWMQVSVSDLGSDAILLDLFPSDIYPSPVTSGITEITFEIADYTSGSTGGGIWVGLAIITDGDSDPTWQWEMSNTTSCWFNHGGSGTCTFDMTTYTDDDGNTVTMDMDRVYKYSMMINAEGASGDIYFNYMTSNAGTISDFDTTSSLFVAGDATQIEGLESISLYSNCGGGSTSTSPIEKAATVAQSASFSMVGNNLTLSLAKAANVSVDLYSVAGSRVKTLHKGSLSSGSHSYSMDGLSKGLYIVRAKGQGVSLVRTVRVK